MRKSTKIRNVTVVKRSNKVGQALNLPKVLNLNPRSIYTYKAVFCLCVCVCVSVLQNFESQKEAGASLPKMTMCMTCPANNSISCLRENTK